MPVVLFQFVIVHVCGGWRWVGWGGVGWRRVEGISTYAVRGKLISHPSDDSRTAQVAPTHYGIFHNSWIEVIEHK
jgi:hypothetical protein